jgi:glucose-6-phosphate isomerase|tara:strand:+ start:1271 stop:2767 length:1497 start_codon:yes stop_codon:yes gene_type:complete
MKSKVRNEILESIKLLANKYDALHIKDLVNKERLSNFQVHTDQLSYDYSKQRLTQDILDELLSIPEKIDLTSAIQNISAGNFMNETEGRYVSHMLHRGTNNSKDTREFKEISRQTDMLRKFIKDMQKVPESHIDTVISISIGGSRLGPELLSEVYGSPYSRIKVYYCSSYDLKELNEVMSARNPARTIIVVSSKSFNTPEIIENAKKAKDWLESLVGESCWDQIFGISSNKKGMTEFGIKDTNQFQILDSVGGRYSIWSSISLPGIIDMGWQNFEDFKKGASEADDHFINSAWGENIPVLMALISCWNMNGLGINNLGIFTYDYKIRSLLKYLSQMGMESNGKSFNDKNRKSPFKTCPLMWGGYGPDVQHSLFEWLLQGTDYSACDFIGIKEDDVSSNSYEMMLAQILALSLGRDNQEYKYKSVEGNNPTSLLKLRNLNPRSLGFLIATYEHKVFVESQIYGINAFDQWGVELGKVLIEKSIHEDHFINKYFDKPYLP